MQLDLGAQMMSSQLASHSICGLFPPAQLHSQMAPPLWHQPVSHRLKFSRERESLSQSFSLIELIQVGYLLGNQFLDLGGFGGLLSRGKEPCPRHIALELESGASRKEHRVPVIKEGRRDAGQLS